MPETNKRWGDPEAWNCLDDAQRDVIHEWYSTVVQNDRETREEKLKISRSAADTIVVPLSVWYAVSHLTPAQSWLGFALNLVAALLFFFILSMISYHVGDFACRDGFKRANILGYRIVYGIVACLLLAKIYM